MAKECRAPVTAGFLRCAATAMLRSKGCTDPKAPAAKVSWPPRYQGRAEGNLFSIRTGARPRGHFLTSSSLSAAPLPQLGQQQLRPP